MRYSVLLYLFLISFSSVADSLKVSDAWIKNLPPVVPMRAGYMTIENHSAQTLKIVDVESNAFMQVDIHETVENDGMMTMQPLSPLSVPPGASIKLTPGGIHLMMMQPKQSLKPGDLVDITLRFDDGNTQTLQMTVRK